jgi:moderate conductance mechanosensitive channel
MLKYRISFNYPLCLCILLLIVTGGLTFILFSAPTVLAEETAEKPEINDDPIAETSDTEQILSLLATIEADQEALGELKEDLQEKETEFRKMTVKLEEVREQLQAMEQPEDKPQDPSVSSKGKPADANLDRLKGDYGFFRKHVDLALVAKKTTLEKIKALEKKIENDRKVLGNLRGTDKSETETKPLSPQKALSQSQKKSSPVSSLVQRSMKVKPSEESKVTPIAQEGAFKEDAETPEQIEARKEAEESVIEAQEAERDVVDFVAHKKSLQKQIELDEKLLLTTEQSLANMKEFLKKRLVELEENKNSGIDREKLPKLQQDIQSVQRKIGRASGEIVERKAHLNGLRERLAQVRMEKETVVSKAEQKREIAEEARGKSVWLQSPFHPDNLLDWVTTRGPRILMVIFAVALLLLISRLFSSRLARVFVHSGRGVKEGRDNRAQTIALSFGAVGRILIILFGFLMVLQEAGMDVKTVLGGAAILGLAVAFGAQNLMRDYFSGFMILLEDQYELGDIVTIGNMTGTVEKVNMRTTVLRDLEGRVHFIPNGKITQVTNKTFEWARAVFDIDVAFEEDVDKVMGILLELAGEIGKDPRYSNHIIDEPVMQGVDGFGESAVTIKFMIKTKPNKMLMVKREMLRRIKNRFDQVGIKIPVPRRIVLHGERENV